MYGEEQEKKEKVYVIDVAIQSGRKLEKNYAEK
jgi:hypothetical protein